MSCSDGRQYIKGAIFTGRLFTAGAKRQVKADLSLGKSRIVKGFVNIDFIEH